MILPILLPLISIIFSYLLGSFPTGFIAGKLFAGVDLRELGSGSTGATNVLRHVGKFPALSVFLIDVAKGTIAILVARTFNLDESWQVLSGVSALAGHIWPIWLKWQGGKAVATGLGVFLGISWQVGLAALGVFLIILSISKIVSLSSIFAAVSLPILMLFSFKDSYFSSSYFLISIVAMTMVLWRHRTNFKRLLKGEESKIGKTSS